MVHGFMGEPNGGWRPWLMGKLSLLDIWAFALAMPNPNEPKRSEWVAEISRAVGIPNEEVFIVGHSLGAPAILRYLEALDLNQKIGGVVLVSGPCHLLNVENKESELRKIDNFLDQPFNFEHIKKVCKNFVIIHGDNDPRVPFDHAEELSKNLDCELISISNGGHLNGSSGWVELPEALHALEVMMK